MSCKRCCGLISRFKITKLPRGILKSNFLETTPQHPLSLLRFYGGEGVVAAWSDHGPSTWTNIFHSTAASTSVSVRLRPHVPSHTCPAVWDSGPMSLHTLVPQPWDILILDLLKDNIRAVPCSWLNRLHINQDDVLSLNPGHRNTDRDTETHYLNLRLLPGQYPGSTMFVTE